MSTYTFHVNIYDLAFFAAIIVGTTFAVLLWFTKRIQHAANRFLSLATGTIILWIAGILGNHLNLLTNIPLPSIFLLGLGPFIFFYVAKITRPEYRFRPPDLLHFFPLLIGLAVEIFYPDNGIKTVAGSAFSLLTLASAIIYLYLSHKLILRYYQELEFTGGDRQVHELRWLRNFLLSFALLWLLWIFYIAAAYYYQLGANAYYPIYLLTALIIIWTSAVVFLKAERNTSVATISVLKPQLSAEMKRKAMWLKNAVKEKNYYQDPELTLNSLAEKLELTTHDLSRIINTGLKKSFNDFINEYRVADVVQKMQDPAYNHLTLLGVAFESGFSSKTTFNRAFKQITGKSPADYKISLEKERPFYKLGRIPRFATVISFHESTPEWFHEKLNRNYMFRNYLKIAWRNLKHNKSYTAINLVGLSVGIAVCMLIFMIIQFHTSYDSFHPKRNQVYRVLTETNSADGAGISHAKNVPFPLPEGLKTAFPQLEQVAPVYASHNDELQVLDDNGTPLKNFKEESGVFYTEPSFFSMFNFPLLAGSYSSLKDPNNVLLTKETAETYFGDWKKAIGKTIKLTGYYNMGAALFQFPPVGLKVSGILATIPANTDFQLKMVVAYGTDFTGDRQYGFQQPGWNGTSADFGCFVLLPPNSSAENFNQQLKTYSRKVLPPENKNSHLLQPLDEVHYDTETGNYTNKTISRQLLNVLWLIAAFILLIACVNFINLATAQAVNRAKEVGVRKVLGSTKGQLQIQFIIETLMIVIGAVILAAVVVLLALPSVNMLLQLSLSFNVLNNPALILFLLAVTLIVTALAGFYPSVVLSGFNPVNALKSKLTLNIASGISLRRGLVVFQFTIAQVLIIGTLVIVRQMNYFMNQPLGFDKDAIVSVPFRPDSTGNKMTDYLREQLLQVKGIQSVSFSSNTPVEDVNNKSSAVRFNQATHDENFQAIVKFADEQYLPTYKLKLVAGRNLQPSGWTKEFVVNESFVKSLGLKNPEDILTKEVSIMGGLIKCPVVGVVKDFNDRSFRHSVAPLLIATNATMYREAAIKMTTTDISATMQSVKIIWEKTFPNYGYDYKFLDEKIDNFYKQEKQLASLYKIFAGIAIFLSCLGLYGLASFMAVQRVKEVGIRKVLGATTGSIAYLFSKEFIILIAIALIVATPIAWYLMHKWLQDYAYRIDISWWLFALSGLATVIIALATISFQAVKAAMSNPVKSLRSE